MLLPVDVVVKGAAGLIALVGDRDPGRLAEGHRPVAIAPPAFRRNPNRNGHERLVHPVADAEEVADGALHARVFFPVPVHPQRQQPGIERRFVGDGAPNVSDDAGSLQLRQRERPARVNAPPVVVAVPPVRVRGGIAPGGVVFELFQARQRTAGRRLGGGGSGETDEGQSDEQVISFHGNIETFGKPLFNMAAIGFQPSLARFRLSTP